MNLNDLVHLLSIQLKLNEIQIKEVEILVRRFSHFECLGVYKSLLLWIEKTSIPEIKRILNYKIRHHASIITSWKIKGEE